jgi:hypothetical protein
VALSMLAANSTRKGSGSSAGISGCVESIRVVMDRKRRSLSLPVSAVFVTHPKRIGCVIAASGEGRSKMHQRSDIRRQWLRSRHRRAQNANHTDGNCQRPDPAIVHALPSPQSRSGPPRWRERGQACSRSSVRMTAEGGGSGNWAEIAGRRLRLQTGSTVNDSTIMIIIVGPMIDPAACC